MGRTTRKEFLGTGLLAFGGVGLFNIGYAAQGRPKPSERVNLAVIGCGTQGFANTNGFLQDKRVQITTVCDPVLKAGKYSYKSEATCGRKPAKDKVDRFYGNSDCKMVADFRDVIADPSVDAVLIATPDHWHAIQAIRAMKAGKHVYCQKPMSFGISEGKEMVRVAKETGVTFQVGSQQRTLSEFRVAAELVASGYIGECRACDIGLPGGNDGGSCGHKRDVTRMKAPDYFSPDGMWDLWQGPARHWEDNVFIPGIHEPMCWRWNSRTGGGQITDWGAHHLDILQWTLGMDESGPVAIENMVHDRKSDDRVFDWAANYAFDVVYANGFRAHVTNKFWRKGLLFHGSKGDIYVERGKLERPDFLRKWNEKKDLKEGDVHLYRPQGGGSHAMDFIDAVYSGGRTACPCSVGHRSITIAHIANICERLGVSSIKWDPVAERFPDNEEANRMSVVQYHNGWTV